MRSEEQAIIGAGVRVRGTVRGAEPLRVEGRIDGRVELEGVLSVEASGIVKADVTAHEIVVSGVVVGELRARDRLTLRPTAQVRGGLHAPRLVLEAGARVDGPVRIGSAEAVAAMPERPRPVVVAVPPAPEPPAFDDESSGEGPEADDDRRTRVVVKKRP